MLVYTSPVASYAQHHIAALTRDCPAWHCWCVNAQPADAQHAHPSPTLLKKTDASTLCGLCNSNATRIAGFVKFFFRAHETLAASKSASARPPVPLQGTHCCIHSGAIFLHAVLVSTNRPPALLFNVAAAGPTEENLGTLPVNEIAQKLPLETKAMRRLGSFCQVAPARCINWAAQCQIAFYVDVIDTSSSRHGYAPTKWLSLP